jgi:hypothetical protein
MVVVVGLAHDEDVSEAQEQQRTSHPGADPDANV